MIYRPYSVSLYTRNFRIQERNDIDSVARRSVRPVEKLPIAKKRRLRNGHFEKRDWPFHQARGNYLEMRDPSRIHRILHRIQPIWTQNPDLRLTQLLINAARLREASPELYCYEDSKLEKALEKYSNELKQSH